MRRPAKRRGFFRRFWWVFVLIPLLGLAVLGGTLFYVYENLTIPNARPLAQTTYLTYRNGDPLTSFHTAVDRKVIEYDQIPESLRNAVIATEDKDFWRHGGVSPMAIVRAAWADITHGSIVEGGSTITQQYVKTVYLSDEQTLTRKIKEAMLAVKLEKEYSKKDILKMYLNTIYFGHGAYGVEAAAQTYFGIHASELKPVQSALLAGLISAPSALDPSQHKAAARDRRDYVTDRMVAEGYVDSTQATKMKAQPIVLRQEATSGYSDGRDFFAWYVRGQLDDWYGEEAVTSGGLHVRTTLDPEWQTAAEQAVQLALPDPHDPEAALVAIDPSNGQVLAMVGGRSYTRAGQFNLATQALRQAGSAFKMFTLATALKQGYSLNSYWDGPSSITIPDERCLGPGGPWTLSNADPGESGSYSLASATAHSVNTVFAQVVVADGMSPDRVAKTAHDLGISSPLGDPAPCSITLGSQGVSPLDMTSSYATIANQGVYEQPTGVISVRDPGGQKKHMPPQKVKQAIDPNVANAVTYALRGVVQYGTGTAANIGAQPVAGKTGTSQDFKNAWFCGYTAPSADADYTQVAVCVWTGYKKTEKPMENVGVVSGPIYGGTIPASVWQDFVLAIQLYPLNGSDGPMPIEQFPPPDLSQFTVGPEPPPPSPKPEKSASATPSPEGSPTPKPKPSPTG